MRKGGEKMFCDQCGAKFDEDSKFCGSCGATRKVSSVGQDEKTFVEPSTPQSTPVHKSRRKKGLIIVGVLGLAFIAFFWIGSMILQPSTDSEVDIDEPPSEVILEEIIDDTVEYPVDDIVDELEELDESPFNLEVWGDSIQLETEDITLDVPIPSREIDIHVEHYFLINTLWYSVSGGFDSSISFDEWNTGVIQMVENSDMILDFSYQKYELEGLHLIAMERERNDDGISRFDTGFFLAFEYKEHFFHMSITLPEGFADQGVVKEDFLEAYGIHKFIDAGLLEMNEWRQAQVN